jgi:hypothetical protein
MSLHCDGSHRRSVKYQGTAEARYRFALIQG